MHAAKHQVIRIRCGGKPRKLQGIAGQIGMLVHIGPLIMVREYDCALSERGFGLNDALLAIIVLQSVKTFKC